MIETGTAVTVHLLPSQLRLFITEVTLQPKTTPKSKKFYVAAFKLAL
jgi:hypothetical protein